MKKVAPFAEYEAGPTVDGGWVAWTQVFASFMIHFATIGFMMSFGVYNEAYRREPFLKSSSTTAIAFIGSLGPGCLALFGYFSGYLVEMFGFRIMGSIGGFIFAVSLVIASFSTSLWQLILLQGALLGTGLSLAYFPALAVINQWFDKRKGFAMGVAASGAGLGGLVMSPLTRYILSNYGWPNALRVSGICGGLIIILCSLLLKTRVKPVANDAEANYSYLLHDPTWGLLCASIVFYSMGYFVPFYFVSVYSVQHGLSSTEGAVIVGIMNVSNGCGRIALGWYN
jgi:MFS family permease